MKNTGFRTDHNLHKKTDWTKYYSRKKSFFSEFTQKYTMRKIFSFYDCAVTDLKNIKIMELGGGNSCFAEEFCALRDVYQYDIIDNNHLATALFNKKELKVSSHTGILHDLTHDIYNEPSYDFVYSIGLIEHFSPEKRKKVIENHFSICKQNGHVLISFPTPTFKYRFWRKFMELIHVWSFWDEIPLTMEDIKDNLEKYGKIVRLELNRNLFLTQLVVLIKKEYRHNE